MTSFGNQFIWVNTTKKNKKTYTLPQMESLVREMQDPENGVPVRSQKLFLTSIPSAFMGQSLVAFLLLFLKIK